jgi:hypothetical protein
MRADLCDAGIFASVEEAVPFAVVAASPNRGDRERSAAPGFGGHMQEPMDRETFVGKIERFLPEWFARPDATPEAQ